MRTTTNYGQEVSLRPIRADDAPRLVEFHRQLSPRSVYRRFFFVHPTLSAAEVERFTCVDYVDRLALIAEDGDRLIAVGRYDRSPGSVEAEVAFVVADEYQHRGIATLLLAKLADAARLNGITTFVASVLRENRDMVRVFCHSGFHVSTAVEDAVVTVRLALTERDPPVDLGPTPGGSQSTNEPPRESARPALFRRPLSTHC
jgi:GNAT superfamily N-acetyltransferase